MFRRTVLPALLLVACTSLYADVTMRMGLELKFNVAIPGDVPKLPFNEISTRIKGDRGYAVFGPIVAITDLSTGKITLLDAKGQRFATITMADYISKLAGAGGPGGQNMPEEAKQMLAKIKFEAESHDTGRTSRIQGIDAVEREVVIHMTIPVPIPGQENGLRIDLKMQIWKPAPTEFERVPALRELAAYNERNKGFGDASAILRQMFGTMPGVGDQIGKMADEMKKGGQVMLGMRIGLFVPGLAKMMQTMGKGEFVAMLPPEDQPLASVNMDLKELSSDKVADEVFAIPASYKEAKLEDLMEGLSSGLTGAKPKAAHAKPAEPAAKELKLCVEASGTDLLLTWDKDSAVIASAKQGMLSIDDGAHHEKFLLDPSQLKAGTLPYKPVSLDARFQLEVTGIDQSKTVTNPVHSSDAKPPAPPAK
jgi:hypothetical protein